MMSPISDVCSETFAVRSRRVLTADGMVEAAVVIKNGLITALTPPALVPPGVPIVDCGDLVVMAGLVDTHVHINEPGRTDWEGFTTATQAAAAGGITTLVDMPLNSSPVTTTAAALELKRQAAAGRCRVDCGFYGGLVHGNAPEIPGLLDAGVLGIKAFLIDSGLAEFSPAQESDLRAVLPLLAGRGAPLLAHAELAGDAALMTAPASYDPTSYTQYLASRPRLWEQRAVRLLIDLCAEYQAPVHIVHLADADSLPLLAEAQAAGLPLTVETCPHYLCLAAEDVPDGDTRFKCAPPIRERENRERLWEGLRAGVISSIVSDHSPCSPNLKCLDTGDFARAWGGIASLQLGLPLVWTAAQARGFGLTDVGRWMSAAPARLVGLAGRKGALASGYDADITIWDPDAALTVRGEALHHRHPVTPYEGQTLRGVVHASYARGRLVYQNGTFPGEPHGILLTPENAL